MAQHRGTDWGPGSRVSHYDRQVAFVSWVTDLFHRAALQQIPLEPLTDFELEWIGRM